MIRLLSVRRPPSVEESFWALKDLSFQIRKGDIVGLIGTNGSGKSTALKVMAGILTPTEGEVAVQGRISALLELGSGMHPDLTGRENVFLNGSLLGLSNAEMEALYPKIVEFSELGRFMHMPIKHYSSGMYMRLGFSVAVHVRPDILLLDEVLAVGDQSFQVKCLDHLYEMRRRGTTIILVSHGLESVRTICTELIWLHKGELKQQGAPAEVAEAYLHQVHEEMAQGSAYAASVAGGAEEESGFLRWGSGEVEVRAVRLRNGREELTDTFLTGDRFIVEVEYEAHEPQENPLVGVAICRADGTHINGPNSKTGGLELHRLEGCGTVRYIIPALPLMPGFYDLTVAIYDSTGTHPFDVHDRAYSFQINPGGTQESYGLLHIPSEWEHRPPAATLPAERDVPLHVTPSR